MGNIVRIKPLSKPPDVRKLADDARGAFDASLNETGQWAKRKFEDITSGWKHRPSFVVRRTQYTVSVDVTGPNSSIWHYVDQGTKSHVIRAKNRRGKRGNLTFRTGYAAKTRPNNSVFKGSGTASGPWVSKKQIRHPGTKGRGFTVIVANQAKTEGRKILRTNLQRRRLPI